MSAFVIEAASVSEKARKVYLIKKQQKVLNELDVVEGSCSKMNGQCCAAPLALYSNTPSLHFSKPKKKKV